MAIEATVEEVSWPSGTNGFELADPRVTARSFTKRGEGGWLIIADRMRRRDRSKARDVRSHLLNAWTARESLRAVLKMERRGQIPGSDSKAIQDLQTALNDIHGVLERTNKSVSMPASETAELLQAVSLVRNESDVTALVHRFEHIRPTLLAKIEELVRRENERYRFETLNQLGMDAIVTENDYSTTIYGNVTNSVVGHFNDVRESINDARASVSSELVQRLEEIETLAQDVARELADGGSGSDAELISSDVNDLVKESVRPEPRASRLKNLIDGVTKIAQKAAQHGPALIGAAAALAKVLGL